VRDQLPSWCRLGAVFLLLACGLVLTSCRDGNDGDLAGEGSSGINYLFKPLPAAGEELGAEEWGALAQSIRIRLESLGWGEVELSTGGREGELRATIQGSEAKLDLIRAAFRVQGALEMRRIHLRSEILAADLKGLREAGDDWMTMTDDAGVIYVVGVDPILTAGQVLAAAPEVATGGEGSDGPRWNLRLRFLPEGEKIFRTAASRIQSRPLAICVDGLVLLAPLKASDWENGELVLRTGLAEDDARELAFALSAPLLMPTQIVARPAAP